MAKGKYQEWLEPEKLILIEGWARDGLTDEQIAEKMGICRDTLIEWKKKYSDISDTLKKGKEVVDRLVENALLKKATGEVRTIKKPIKVKEVLYDVISNYEYTLKTPAPFIFMAAHSASSVDFKVRIWVDNIDYWNAYFGLNEKVFEAFKESGIEIPYNKLDVNIINQDVSLSTNNKTLDNKES